MRALYLTRDGRDDVWIDTSPTKLDGEVDMFDEEPVGVSKQECKRLFGVLPRRKQTVALQVKVTGRFRAEREV